MVKTSPKMEALINKTITALKRMISNDDFFKCIDGCDVSKLLKYSELKNYNSIYQLLPEKRDYRIILTETSKNCGHWCCILRYGDTIEWFDSYGGKPDSELHFIPTQMRRMLGEETALLTRLLKTMNKSDKLVYNKTKFQVLNDEVATCGRWVIARIICFLIGYNLEEFKEFIDTYCLNNDMPPDVAVCNFTGF
jgi:hypothetical protein